MPELSDEQLMEASGRGDREAFGLLVKRHHRTVLSFAHRCTNRLTRDAVDDLAQEVFLSAWKSAPTFQPQARVTTWLFRIAANACFNLRRRRRLRDVLTLRDDDDQRLAEAPQSTDRDPRSAEVRDAVDSLPPSQRAAIVLRHFHDMSYTDIAEVLDISVSAVESLLFRARERLRRELATTEDLSPKPQVLPDTGAQP